MFTVVTQLIAKAGLLGVFALMLVENLVPIIPSELILPLAGFEASKGQFSALAAIGAAGLGSALRDGLVCSWPANRRSAA